MLLPPPSLRGGAAGNAYPEHQDVPHSRALARRRRNHGQALPAGPMIEQAMTSIVPPDRLRVTRVQMAWREVAGTSLQGVCWPQSIHRDILTLTVRDNQWLHELVYLQADLMRRLQAMVPQIGVSHIRMRVGAIPPPLPIERDPPPPPVTSMPDEPDAETRNALAAVEDPRLRQIAANARLAMSARLRSRLA